MRRVFQEIVFPIDLSARDRFDLSVDRDHRVAKTVELVLWLTLRWFDHHRAGNGPRNRRRMKPVIDQALRNILDLDSLALPLPKIENAFVCHEAAFAFEKHREIAIEPLRDVICV